MNLRFGVAIVGLVAVSIAGLEQVVAEPPPPGKYLNLEDQHVYLYDDLTETLTDIGPCSQDPDCVESNTETSNGECGYLNPTTLGTDWKDLGARYVRVGSCVNVEATRFSTTSTIKWRDSLALYGTSGHTYYWSNAWQFYNSNLQQVGSGSDFNFICSGHVVLCDTGPVSMGLANPVGTAFLCVQNTLWRDGVGGTFIRSVSHCN